MGQSPITMGKITLIISKLILKIIYTIYQDNCIIIKYNNTNNTKILNKSSIII